MTYTAVSLHAEEIRPGHVKPAKIFLRQCFQWLVFAALAASDLSAFGLTFLLFRIHNPVPTTILYYGKPLIPGGLDVFIVIAACFVVFRWLAGDYVRRQLFWDGARLTTRALAIAAIPDALIYILAGERSIWPMIASWALLFFAIPVLRQCTRRLLAELGLWNLPTALVGHSANAEEAVRALSDSLSLGFDVRYLIVESEDAIPPSLSGFNRISIAPGPEIVRRLSHLGCRQVVVATDLEPSDLLREVIRHILAVGIGVGFVPSLRGLPLYGLTLNYFFGKEILLLQARNNLARLPQCLLKRFMDAIASAALIVLLSPLCLAIMIVIMAGDGGPPFFVQRRLGRRGRQFNCLKFRSMTTDAENLLSKWQNEDPNLLEKYKASNFKLRNDPRVTPVGRWLRRTSLDEFPQLLNVLIGDMSLVGPRPLLEREISQYGLLDSYNLTRPGMTGLWQISGRSETTFKDRIAFDDWYIRNWSIWYDIAILFQTVGVLLGRKGAY